MNGCVAGVFESTTSSFCPNNISRSELRGSGSIHTMGNVCARSASKHLVVVIVEFHTECLLCHCDCEVEQSNIRVFVCLAVIKVTPATLERIAAISHFTVSGFVGFLFVSASPEMCV